MKMVYGPRLKIVKCTVHFPIYDLTVSTALIRLFMEIISGLRVRELSAYNVASNINSFELF